MSFEPVTRWALRCDGDTTHGQCPQQLVYPDTDDPDDPLTVWRTALYERAELTIGSREDLRLSGWLMVHARRVLCPGHVAGLEYLARAALDGLPFDDQTFVEFDPPDPFDDPDCLNDPGDCRSEEEDR